MVAAVLLFSPGCTTDENDIERMNYASAIGIDYKDGKYYGYIQLISFQSTAKSEDQKQEARTWVGEGTGATLDEAIFTIYRTSQERIYWAHLTAIVVSEAAFKQDFESFYEIISRYYEFRRTPWVFGTKQSVREILTTGGFFGQSSLSTILHEPKGTYEQSSTVQSIQLHRLIAQIYEPGFTSIIPTLAVNKKQWTENASADPKLTVDGAIFLKENKFQSYIPIKNLSGLRWLQSGVVRAGVPVPDEATPTAQIVINNPKTKIKYVAQEDGIPRFDISLKASAYVVSRFDHSLSNLRPLTEETQKAVEDEIRKLFVTGLKKKTDVLNLEYFMYRHHFPQWKAMFDADKLLLNKDSLRNIYADIKIIHSSSEQNNPIQRGQ